MCMENANQLVVVLSRNSSTGLGVIRSLGAAGYTVDLIASSYKKGNAAIAASSKYVRNWVEVVKKDIKSGAEDVELLAELLKYADKNEYKPVLFPTDDYTTSVMDRNRKLLEAYFIMPTIVDGGDNCLIDCMNKSFQSDLAKKAGLLLPKEWIISLKDEIIIPDDMVYPCFCKPIESVRGYKHEMGKCKDSVQLLARLEKMKNNYADRSVLVQEYLNIDDEIDFSGVCIDQKIVIPAIIKKIKIAQHMKGITLAGRVVSVEQLGDVYGKVIDMLKRLRYIGMFDMELNVVGDKIYFNEVNFRSGGPSYAYFVSGVNLPALFVKNVLGVEHSSEEEKICQVGKYFVNENVAWDDYVFGYMNKQELDKHIETADFTLLFDEDDSAPGMRFMQRMRHSGLRRKLINIRRKVRGIRRRENGIRKIFSGILRKAVLCVRDYPQFQKENIRNPFSDKTRVVVVSRNYLSNLTMARSIGQAGYEVEVLRVFQTKPRFLSLAKYVRVDAYSKYIKAYHSCITRRKEKRIVGALRRIADHNHKMLLVPTDDLVADVIDRHMDELRPHYIIPNINNTPGEISRLMSKDIQKELALKAGLPMVNGCVISTEEGYFEIPETVTYPCFVKPNISKNSSKSRMKKCETKEELEQWIVEISSKKDIEMMVEDFVEIDKEYALLGLSTKQGVIIPACLVIDEGGHDARRGVAMTGRVMECSEVQEIFDDIVKFVSSLNFEGLFDVDLIKTTDGKVYFTELNLRFGASGYAVTRSGVNLPGMFADYMLKGKCIDADCVLKQIGKSFVSEKVLLDECIYGYLTKDGMKDRMKSADIHFVKDEDDPKAYSHFRKFLNLVDYMKLLLWWKHRKESK